MTKSEIISLVEKNDVRFIRLQFTDIFGTLKNVAITSAQLQKVLENGCMFDGSSIEGFARIEESDMYLVPDLDTFVILPFSTEPGKVARIICDVRKPDGTPFEGDPRYALKKVLKKAADMGYICNIGPECEFFLFAVGEDGLASLDTADTCGYFDISSYDEGSLTRRSICLALEQLGFKIEASHHENAKNQHEIDFKYGEALAVADKIMTFKLAVKSVARERGLVASFMPKPKATEAGSGMHVNISLAKNGKNVFYDETSEDGLSEIAKSFIAGVMANIKAISAITNPLVNSYKRLVSGYEAPTNIAWSYRNRSPLIRIPCAKEESARIEVRNPDPSCNPYLALAVILGAGLDGIERGLTPPKPENSNIFKLTKEERKQKNIDQLPSSLSDAIKELEKNELVRGILGDVISPIYIEAKKEEWRSYRLAITKWELEHYLNQY